MSDALTLFESVTYSAARETPLSVVLQDLHALVLRLKNLTEEEARACERAILEACAELAALTGRLASHHYSPCTRQESAAESQLTITDLTERCWCAAAACQVAWAMFGYFRDAAKDTFYRLLTSCSASVGPACSLMHELCAAARLDPPEVQQVATRLASGVEVVLSALRATLRYKDTVLADLNAALVPVALRPAALLSLLKDAVDVMHFVAVTAGLTTQGWSAGVWDCLSGLLTCSGKRSLQQQHVRQLRSLAVATHSSLFTELSCKGFSDGWGERWRQVIIVLVLCSSPPNGQLVALEDSTICEQCGVLLGLLPLVGGTQGVLWYAVYCMAWLSMAAASTLYSAREPGAQPPSVTQLLLCMDAFSLCAGATMAAVELGSSATEVHRCPVSLPVMLERLRVLLSLLTCWMESWGAAGMDGRGRGSGSEATQLAASAAEAAECAMRLAGLLLRKWGSIEVGSREALGELMVSSAKLLATSSKLGGSSAAFIRASCSASVAAGKLALTELELPQARKLQYSSDGSMQHNQAASALLSIAADCCTVATPDDDTQQDSWRRQQDSAVLSLLYAGQRVALSSTNCKNDVASITRLLQLGAQLAEGTSSALLFHNLGGVEMLTTACMRLLEYDFADFVSAQPGLGYMVSFISDRCERVGLQAGIALAVCGFVERLVCWVEKGLGSMAGKASKKLRTVLAELRELVMSCCVNVVYEAHLASGGPAAASCHDCPSCRWRAQHAAWFEGAAEKQLCSAKMWARFRQEALPHVLGLAAAAAKARHAAGTAGREVALQRAAAALQARECAHLGCTNLRGCCEGRLPAQRQGEAGRFCSPECQAAAEGQLGQLCNQAA